ncbi:MAG: GDSL-type esterase/lipase family protein [Flavobacteriaceae bacterium]
MHYIPDLISKYFWIFFFAMLSYSLVAQEVNGFEEDVIALGKKYDSLWDRNRESLVFTGSSSIRLWENLQDYFPQHQIINTGFGGSQTTDLLVYLEELVLKYEPAKVFIYEGDNDINDKVKPVKIIKITKEVITQIKKTGRTTSIVLISAKPSIKRWHLRRKYRRFNRKLEKLSKTDPLLEFANVWDPMLERRKLKEDLFIEDGLHMNLKGYEIWYEVISKFVN